MVRLGVGAISADKSPDGAVRREASALDLLRKRILGKKAGNTMSVQKPRDVSSEDEEEGRATAVITRDGARPESSKGIISSPNVKTHDVNVEGKTRLDGSAKALSANFTSTKRKSASFLDEILAEKANKKKRKKRKLKEDLDKGAVA